MKILITVGVLALLALSPVIDTKAKSPSPESAPAPALKPPLGWNSYDCFGMLADDQDIKVNADDVAAHLKKFGWEYIVLDYLWYAEGLTAQNIRDKNPVQNIDEFGRLIPSIALHPSSKGGKGFKPLADYVHGLGLKFGIHIMRGIPIQAVEKNTPIPGSTARARDVADPNDGCSWYQGLYGVNVSKPGGQEYYDSIVRLYTEWGVDYIKADDMSYPYHAAEIAALGRAIRKCGRPMVLSLSPGPAPLDRVAHLRTWANLWRISGDFWDEWPKVLEQFGLCRAWAASIAPGHWPDADMLPLGKLSIRTDLKDQSTRWTRLTRDEQLTVMTLWSIFRSPLMFGGHMPDNDAFTLSLLTNAAVLDVDQNSLNNREVFSRGGLVAWAADVPGSGDKYLALFNTTDKGPSAVTVTGAELTVKGKFLIRDLWAGTELGAFEGSFSALLRPHGAGLYRVEVRSR